MCEQYNGWTNRETWATKLWLDNDRGLYDLVQDYTSKAIEEHNSDEAGSATGCLAETLEDFVTELLDMEEVLSAPLAQRKELINMSSDIGSLYRVNWREMAESYLEEAN